MQVQIASKLPVDGAIVAPDVFLQLATAKAQTPGTYLSGQPLSSAPVLSVWGIPLVVSAALAAGTGLVGSFRRGGAIYRKGTVRIDISNSHADFFIKNLSGHPRRAARASAVYNPEAFAQVTNLGAAT